jgi:probable HAF family extracellular repeat protein
MYTSRVELPRSFSEVNRRSYRRCRRSHGVQIILACSAAIALSTIAILPANAQSFFPIEPLTGDTESFATGIIAQGTLGVGASRGPTSTQAVTWSVGTTSGIGFLPNLTSRSIASAVNAAGLNGPNGLVVVGQSESNNQVQAFRRTSGAAPVALAVENFSSLATGVNGDGSVIVGARGLENSTQGFRWTAATGFVDLGLLPGANTTIPRGINQDGSVVIGTSFNSEATLPQAFRWTAAGGIASLGGLPGYDTSIAEAVSADGSVVVGTASRGGLTQAFRWTAGTGMVGLDTASGTLASLAHAVSSDGSVVVGTIVSRFNRVSSAGRWTPAKGWESIHALLGSVVPVGWTLVSATAVGGPNGQVIAGNGIFNGKRKAWVANVPLPAPSGTNIFAATLPNARTSFVPGGPPVTGFASIINNGSVAATQCSIAQPFDVPGTFSYQRTNAQNVPVGSPNVPVDIPAGATQTFVFSLTPSDLFSIDVTLIFKCTNTARAPVLFGVNTFLVSAGPKSITDMLSIADTLTHDGIANIPGVNGTGLMVTAAIDIGNAGTVTCAPTPTPFGQAPRSLAANLFICQTNNQGQCVNPPSPGPSATVSVLTNQTVFFSTFIQGTGQTISFDPGNSRVFFLCKEGGTPVGEASVAVRTQ